MFFIMGITEGHNELNYDSGGMNICKSCGVYSRYTVFMTYMCLSLFFIPTFKWGKKYYVKASCCGSIFELNEEKGKAIAHGEDVRITDEDLTVVRQYNRQKSCRNCGYRTLEDFEFCPKCGERF